MLTAVCIILILLTLISFDIVAEVRADFGRSNSVTFFLFGLKVITIKIDFTRSKEEILKIELKSGDKLITSLGIKDLDKDKAMETAKSAVPNPFCNLDIVELEVYAELGIGNALGTVVEVMVARSLIEGAHLLISASQKVKVLSFIKPVFDESKFIVDMSGIFSITIADIIYGIILGKRRQMQQ